jgi:4-amino-4-deoxy-L-arabinose transferase-like glycosyltransferase
VSIRLSYAFAVVVFLLAAVLRFASFSAIPPGLSDKEISNVRITETIRQGRVEVFYDLDGEGREGLYHIALTGITAVIGAGAFDFRLLSLFVGLIGLGLVYALTMRLCGPLAGAAAIALLAVNMAAVLLARTVVRDAMLMPWVAAVMLALARAFFVYGDRAQARPDSAAFAALGVLLGLGFYLHPLALIVTLFALAFIVYRVFTVRPFPRRALSFTWFMLVVMIVLAIPYFLSSVQHPELAGTARLTAEFPASITALFERVSAGVNGLLFVGDPDPRHNLPARPLFDLVTGVLITLGGLVALRHVRQPGNTLVVMALFFLLPAVLVAPVAPNFQVFSAVLPPLAALFGMGVSTLFYSLRRWGRVLVALGLVILLGWNISWVINDLFVRWAALPEVAAAYNTRLGALARFLDRSADTPALLCLSENAAGSGGLNDAHKLALMMHRADVPLRVTDCGTNFVLTDGGDTQHIVLLEPGDLNRINPAFARWTAGAQVITDADVPPGSIIRTRSSEALANAIGAFTTTTPITFARDEPGSTNIYLPPIRLEGNLAFLGYESDWGERLAPGDLLRVVTYWRVDGRVPPDLSFFTHIQDDPAARPAAQRDTRTVLPELLEPRDVLIQVSYIDLPFTLPAGTYSISVGAYESGSGRRLSAFIEDAPRGTRLFLGSFIVE